MYQDRFDEAEWTYACRFTPGGDSDADYGRHIEAEAGAVARAAAAGKRLAILSVLDPGAPSPGASRRKQITEVTGRPEYRTVVCAIVTTNPFVRGLVKALKWLQPAEHPEQMFGEVGSALSWMEAERGQPLPALRALADGWDAEAAA